MVIGAHEFDGIFLLAALGQRSLHLRGGLGHGLIHTFNGDGGALRDRGDNHRLGVLGQAGGQAGLGLGGITVAGSLEQIGDDGLLRGDTHAARVGKAQTARGKNNQQKQNQEDLEARMAMATTDLGLLAVLTILLDHLGLGQRKEARVGRIGHKLASGTRGIERIDSSRIHGGRRGRGHGGLGRKRGK